MDNLSGCKVVHIDSRRRIALQCVDLLLPGATPQQRKRIANRILVMCGGKGRVHSRRERKPRRLTPELLDDLLRIHASCVHDQEGRCPAAPVRRVLVLGNQSGYGRRERCRIAASSGMT